MRLEHESVSGVPLYRDHRSLLRLDAPSAVHNLRLIWQRVEPPSHRYGGPRDNHLGVRIVAITGIILIVFVIGHLLGNLQIFIGPDWINGYSQHLRDLGPLLWAVRLFLLAAVAIHIWVTIQLAIENRRARPKPYIDRQYVKATFASRHMVMSGLIVLAFIAYHLAHFTFRKTDLRFALLRFMGSKIILCRAFTCSVCFC